MAGMCVRHASLSCAIGLRPGVERAHPTDLVGADALGCAGHPFRTEVGCIGQYASQHGRDIPRSVTRANMGEVIRKAGPFMHLPQEIRHLDQRIELADLGIQFLGCCGNLAGCWRDDQAFHLQDEHRRAFRIAPYAPGASG